MPCYHPITAYRSRQLTSTGKQQIVFDKSRSANGIPLQLSCGQCIGCRLERSRRWALRCLHESSLYESNCFITLTYDEANLPYDGSLNVAHFQKFMKRLRKKYGKKIKYYHCGEYGELTARPHFHACIFNHDFDDKVLFRTVNDNDIYTSEALTRLWPFGFSTIGDVTFESAAYVARYILKKVNGEKADEHYEKTIESTGEVIKLSPEYTTMSNGIGKGWYEKWKEDVYPSDSISHRGKLQKPPAYYDGLYELEDPEGFEKIKLRRKQEARKHTKDNTPERLATREKVKQAQLTFLKRKEI